MKAVDTNILLYAHRKESKHHEKAFKLIRSLSGGRQAWAIPWPCVSEFLRVATHPHFYQPPTRIEVAIQNMRSLLAAPTLSLLMETERHADIFLDAVERYEIRGNLIFDAKIYALCQEHGVSEILTADADFLRFKEIQVINPFA